MIYKMARDRNEESKDVKRGSVIKDKNGTLITDHNAVRGEETRKAREHVYWFCQPVEGIRHSVKSNGDGNVALAGSARRRGQDGGGNI